MNNQLDKERIQFLECENSSLKQEVSLLTQENLKLQSEIEKLEVTISQITQHFFDRLQSIETRVKEEIIKPLHLAASHEVDYYKKLTECNEKFNSILYTLWGKYSDAPQEKSKKADEFWAYWKQVYEIYSKKGKGDNWALQRVQDEIKTSGTWSAYSRKSKTGCPDLVTIGRQLSPNYQKNKKTIRSDQ
jgi:hypothetical protein